MSYEKYDESLKVMEMYLRKVCEENIEKRVEVPRKVLVRKPNRRIVTNGMRVNEIMRLKEYSVKVLFLIHNLKLEEKKKIKNYILQLLDFSDEFLVENVLKIKESLPCFCPSELKSYIIKYIDLRIKVFTLKSGTLNYGKHFKKVLSK